MIEDTLSRVNLSESAVERWLDMSLNISSFLREHGVKSAEDVADELARIEADGSLTLYIPLPDGTELSIRVEPHEWAWRGSRNQ